MSWFLWVSVLLEHVFTRMTYRIVKGVNDYSQVIYLLEIMVVVTG